MKLLLCVVLLLGGCYGTSLKNYKKPNNNIHQENLQEKFEEIDINKDGVIDYTEAKKHTGDRPTASELKTPTWPFLMIMGLMLAACVLPITFTYIAGKVRDFREKKRV